MADDEKADMYTAMVGSYIRAQRQLADLSLRQLAAMTNVSNAYLSQVERGLHQPSVKVLRSIADALNLPGEKLFTQAGLINPEPQGAKGTEAAIAADPDLSEQEKKILVDLYRQFRRRDR
jgi:transcriptional regulator with XRE-family HTH domain